jgi:hypothetical protein
MANRNADAGVMVFASSGCCPVTEPFQWFDHKAVVVLDRATLDPHALRLACLWARWTACRESEKATDTIDVGRITGLLDQARRTLKTASTIRGHHTKAKKAIDDAGRQVGEMTAELEATLDHIEEGIGS